MQSYHQQSTELIVGLLSVLLFSAWTVASAGSTQSDSLVLGSSDAMPAEQLTTEQILQGAAQTASAGLEQRLNYLQQITDDAVDGLDPDSPVSDMVDRSDSQLFAKLGSQNRNLLFTSLGINDPEADVLREGNVVIVNPDEQAVCQEDAQADSAALLPESSCVQLVAKIMIRVESITQDSGVIVYQYGEDPLLSIGYAPMGVVYDFAFSTLSMALQAAAMLDATNDEGLPATVTGIARLSARMLDQEAGSTAAEFSLNIVEALVLVDNSTNRTVLSLKPSTVFKVNTDEATESVTTEINWGALQLAQQNDDSMPNNRQFNLTLGGPSGRLSSSGTSQSLQLSNVSIGGVPLNINIDSVDSISLGLDSFGATLHAETSRVTLTSALGLQFAMDNLSSVITDLANQYQEVLTASAAKTSDTDGQEKKGVF